MSEQRQGGVLPKVVIVDDSPDVRTLVRAQIRMSKRLEVIGEGVNGLDAVALASRHQPDVMLLDVSMPVIDGLAALPRVLDASPSTRVVMYSGFDESGLASRAKDLGATAYVSKSAPFEVLLDTLVEQAGERAVAAPDRSDDSETGVGTRAQHDGVLEEHLERFREVFEDAAIGMATMTLAGRMVRANHSLCRLLGVPAGDLVGVAFADLANDPAAIDDALLSLDAGESVVEVEHSIRSGGDRLFRSTLSSVIDSRGRPLYIFLQVQDVTRQVAAEAELRRTEARFRLLVEAVQDYAIFMLDPSGHIASWNSGAQRSKGYAADEIIGKHFRVFYPPELQQAGHPEYELGEALRHGKYEEEGWRIRKDGTSFWAHVTITAVRDPDGDLIGFAKVTRDTTERREMLERLGEANRRLAQGAEQQAEFLALTAHELRTPVSVLSGATATLVRQLDQLDPGEREQLAEVVTRSATQLQRLLDDLLTASRAHGHRLDLQPVDVDLCRHLEDAVETVRQSSGHAVIELACEPGLRVHADPVRLTQIVDNLVTNALRHGQAPVRVVATGDDGTVEVVVTDAGEGVATELRDQMFERFTTSSRHGTGLGLFLVRELARAHGGEADYRESDGAFVVSLPRA